MVQLKPASARTLGHAKWLGLTLPPDVSDARARQDIYNAPLPQHLVNLAKRLDIDTSGLSYGPAWPLIKKQTAAVEADLMENRGWVVNGVLSWQGELWVISQIVPRNNDINMRDKLRLCGLQPPRLMFGKQKATTLGVQLLVKRSVKTVWPIDLIDAETVVNVGIMRLA